jgi:hypothetical protein
VQLSQDFGDLAIAIIDPIMGRSHRPRGPGRQTSRWQPVPLRVPLDRPGSDRRPTPQNDRVPADDEIDHGSGPADDVDDVGGNHVIVIDLA